MRIKNYGTFTFGVAMALAGGIGGGIVIGSITSGIGNVLGTADHIWAGAIASFIIMIIGATLVDMSVSKLP